MPMSLARVQKYCRRLRQNDPNLTTIDLAWERIGDEGALALAQALPNNAFLKKLNLRFNNITDKGAADLAQALKINTKLKELWLDGNQITDKGATDLANALKINTKLKDLWLGDNQITDKGATALLEALQEHNGSVTYLDLHGNRNISDTTITQQINTVLQQNKNGTRHPLPWPLQASELDHQEEGTSGGQASTVRSVVQDSLQQASVRTSTVQEPSGRAAAAPIVARRRSVQFVRSARSLTIALDPSSTATMGDILDSLLQEDAQQTKVFVLGGKRKKRTDNGEVFRVFSNDKTGSLTEARFRQETVAQVCALDDRQPISFQVEYKEVVLDVSDDESE